VVRSVARARALRADGPRPDPTSGKITSFEPTVESRASPSASRQPSVSSEFVHRHRLARATTALASHCESELGRHAARCLVLSLVNVRTDAVGLGPTPEVADGGVHCLGRDPVIAPLLGYPPARLDLVRLDPIDAISSQAQLRASEEPLLSQIPDRPRPEPALPP